MGNLSKYKFLSVGFMILLINLLVIFPARPFSGDSTSTDPPRRKQRFFVSVSGIYAMLETAVRFEILNGALGLKINMEDHLGFDKFRVMPLFTARITIKNRHNIFGMYYNLPRRSTYVTERELEFNGRIIEMGTRLDGYFDLHSLSIGYMYEIIRQERASLGVFANFFLVTLDTGVSSNLEQINESFKVPGALPNFGVIPSYKLSENIGLSGIVSLFFLNMEDYGGSIHSVGIQLDFNLTRWLDLGFGYYLFDVTIEATESDFSGIFEYTYQGPFLGVGFRF